MVMILARNDCCLRPSPPQGAKNYLWNLTFIAARTNYDIRIPGYLVKELLGSP